MGIACLELNECKPLPNDNPMNQQQQFLAQESINAIMAIKMELDAAGNPAESIGILNRIIEDQGSSPIVGAIANSVADTAMIIVRQVLIQTYNEEVRKLHGVFEPTHKGKRYELQRDYRHKTVFSLNTQTARS